MMSEKIVHADILVKGLVQGVSFRAYTKRKANSLGLSGFVRNLTDGDVEIKVEGSEEQIYRLIKWLRNEGSPASRVEKVLVQWSNQLENYSYFRIAF
ncbi:MAG: acylphosphatase [Candidatus Heimdallarchaeota archaeon]